MVRVEYKTIDCNLAQTPFRHLIIEQVLNDFNKDGWELCGVLVDLLIFKRTFYEMAPDSYTVIDAEFSAPSDSSIPTRGERPGGSILPSLQQMDNLPTGSEAGDTRLQGCSIVEPNRGPLEGSQESGGERT